MEMVCSLSLVLVRSVTVPGYQGNLQAAISHSAALAAWERFGVEFILTFVVVLCYFVSTDAIKKFMGNSAFAIGAAYSACCFVSVSLTLIMMLEECFGENPASLESRVESKRTCRLGIFMVQKSQRDRHRQAGSQQRDREIGRDN